MIFLAFLKTVFVGWGVGFVAAIPAGPVGAAVFAQGMEGRRTTTPVMILGAILVDACYCVMAFLGVDLYLNRWLTNPVVGLAAMALLLGLGFKMTFGSCTLDRKVRGDGTAAGSDSTLGAFLAGVIMSVANPFLLMSWAAIVFVLRSRGIVGTGRIVLVTFATTASLGMGCWLLVLYRTARLGGAWLNRTLVRWVIRGTGVLIMGMGVFYGIRTFLYDSPL